MCDDLFYVCSNLLLILFRSVLKTKVFLADDMKASRWLVKLVEQVLGSHSCELFLTQCPLALKGWCRCKVPAQFMCQGSQFGRYFTGYGYWTEFDLLLLGVRDSSKKFQGDDQNDFIFSEIFFVDSSFSD